MIVRPQKGKFHIPELREHFQKLSWESLDKNKFSVANKHFEKLRVAHPHELLTRIWKKIVEVQK